MYHLPSCFLGGIVAAAAITPFVSDVDVPLATLFEGRPAASWAQHSAAAAVSRAPIAAAVNRARKGDRLQDGSVSRDPAKSIAFIEVVGVNDAAVVYRDRDGRLLFQTDPVANATIVTRGMVLPEVTIRSSATSAAKPLTFEAPRKPKEKTKRVLPDGCESSFSPITDRAMANIPGRCITAREEDWKVASAGG
jgi:hypothetical protein